VARGFNLTPGTRHGSTYFIKLIRNIRTGFPPMAMTWTSLTEKFHSRTIENNYRIDSLKENWQRELAALYRLESEINNGGYLQFAANWSRDVFMYSLQGLQNMGAVRMAEIVAEAQGIIDEQFGADSATPIPAELLFGERIIKSSETSHHVSRSVFSSNSRERLDSLSIEFIRYPDDISELGLNYYKIKLEG